MFVYFDEETYFYCFFLGFFLEYTVSNHKDIMLDDSASLGPKLKNPIFDI